MTDGSGRRDLLRAGGGTALAALTGLAGCLGGLNPLSGGGDGGGDGESGDRRPATAAVPAGAEAMGRVDFAAAIEDEAVRAGTAARLEARAERTAYDGPTTLSGLLDFYREALGPEFREVSTLYPFHRWGDERVVDPAYYGYAMAVDWTAGDLLDQLGRTGIAYERRSVEGGRVYGPEGDESGLWAAHLAEGLSVAGTRAAVGDAVAAYAGEGDRLSGPVRNGYQGTGPDGDDEGPPARFAGRVPTQHLPTQVGAGSRSIELDLFGDVDYVAGRALRDGDRRELRVRFVAEDSETAVELADVLNLYVAARGIVEDDPAMRSMLDSVAIEADGDETTIEYGADPDQWAGLAAASVGFV